MRPNENSTVSIVKCETYEYVKLKESTKESLSLLGGIEQFVKKGDRVLLKPNLLSGKEPHRAVTTHPQFLRAAIELVKEAGGVAFVWDSPSGRITAAKVNSILRITGTEAVCKSAGAELLWLEDNPAAYDNPSGKVCKSFMLPAELKGFDAVISLPKMKTHYLTLMTGAIKHSFGLIPGLKKTEMHFAYRTSEAFSEMLVDLLQAYSPKLFIVDAVVSMEAAGPSSGVPVNSGLVLAGSDGAAVDYVIARILGYKDPLAVPVVRIAKERGILFPEKILVAGENLDSVIMKRFKRVEKGFLKLAEFFKNWLKQKGSNLILAKPVIIRQKCKKCGECIEACPVKAMTPDNEKIPVIDYKKCIRCFCCNETCPHDSIKLRKNIM